MKARLPTGCRVIVAGALVLAAVTGAGWLMAEDGDEPTTEEALSQWQHLALTHDGKDLGGGDLARQINEVGRKGWELVSVETYTESGTTTKTVFFFKKPL